MLKLPAIRLSLNGFRSFQSGIGAYIFLWSAANAAIFQWRLYQVAAASQLSLDTHAVLALVTLFTLQLVISITVLGCTALVSIRIMKVLCAVFTICNSLALYFIVQYNTILDSTMIGNVVNTNIREASDFIHPKIIIYLTVLGILPAMFFWRIRISPSPRLWRVAFVALSIILGSVWLYGNASSWLWIDKNAKRLGGLVLPWSYVFNTIRYFRHETDRNRTTKLLPALSIDANRGSIFVLVIGESARAQNFSLYGYPRPTNPLLKTQGVTALPGAQSCATYTTASLRCMLSANGAQGMNGNDETLPSYLARHGIEVIWRTNNFGEPPLKVTSYETAETIRKTCAVNCSRLAYDEVLLQGLEDRLKHADPKTKTLVILHQSGSHGPQYYTKYPSEFEVFKPACHSVELQNCTKDELVNAYDNTIVYTDYFLSKLIEMLKAVDGRESVMLYMSDHGESLGESGLYLHGVPISIAPQNQFVVPLVVWMSDQFLRRGRGVNKSFRPKLSHDVVFHSVLGAMDLTSPSYLPEQDLFRQNSLTK